MEKNNRLISVLMSCYNEPLAYLSAAIDSILKQTYRDFEFIIILDNPNNQDIKLMLDDYAYEDNRIKIYINEVNMGLPNSLNKGLKLCKGKYIARMDADDVALPERFSEELNFIEKNNYDIVGTWFESFTENKTKDIFKQPLTNEACKKRLSYENCVGHPTWIVKKSVYETLGGYRNILACEDYDFLMRASLRGYKIGNVPRVLLNYRLNSNGISSSNYCRQECCADFLRTKYRQQQSPSIKEIEMFFSSFKGRKKIEKTINLYNKKNEFRLSRNIIKKILCLLSLFISTDFIIKSVKRCIVDKLIMRKDNFYEI